MTITPELAEVISEALESRLIDVHVALPGSVQAYDSSTQTADIELQVKRMLPDGEGGYSSESLPVLKNIPVAFPRGADFFVSFPLPAGSTGLVVFSESSLDQWRSVGAEVSPGDIGRHTLTGGVFMPGLVPNAEAITDPGIGTDAAFGKVSGPQVRARASTVEVTTGGAASASDFVAMSAKVDALWTAFISTCDATSAPDPAAAFAAAVSTAVKATTYYQNTASTNLKADG